MLQICLFLARKEGGTLASQPMYRSKIYTKYIASSFFSYFFFSHRRYINKLANCSIYQINEQTNIKSNLKKPNVVLKVFFSFRFVMFDALIILALDWLYSVKILKSRPSGLLMDENNSYARIATGFFVFSTP